MLFAPSAAKHDLTAPTAVGALKKSNRSDAAVEAVVAAKKKQQQAAAAALLTNGLRHYNHHQQKQQEHRQHHNHQEQQQKQNQNQVQQQQEQNQSQDSAAVQQKQQQQQQRGPHHVPNSVERDSRQPQQQQQQQQLNMENIKKIDSKLVAYLTGDRSLSSSGMCEETQKQQTREPQENLSLSQKLMDVGGQPSKDVFKNISAIKLQMEALTLQTEGTRRMELLQNDIRPIFTVECQLSHELIKLVPRRHDMFHIMQFESEKFHSLTQCTRFGQEAQRDVKLEWKEEVEECEKKGNSSMMSVGGNNETKPNFGRIHFTVWWREPGTCLNEMLGMGVLALEELYAASVMEQCKCIVIQRRDVHLANLYFKITLQVEGFTLNGQQCMEADFKIEKQFSLNGAGSGVNNNNNNDSDNHHDDITNEIKRKINQQQSMNSEIGVGASSAGIYGTMDATMNDITTTGEYAGGDAVHTSLTGRMRVEDTKIQ